MQVEQVTDIVESFRYGIMSTPGFLTDEQVVSLGRVFSAQEIGQLIRKQAEHYH